MTNSKTPKKVRKALQLYFDAVLLIQSFEGSPLRYWFYPIPGWWLNLHSFRLRDCGDDGRLSQKRNFPSYCPAAQKSQMKVGESGNLCFPTWKPHRVVDFIYSEAVHAETLLSSKYVESGRKQTLPPVKILQGICLWFALEKAMGKRKKKRPKDFEEF